MREVDGKATSLKKKGKRKKLQPESSITLAEMCVTGRAVGRKSVSLRVRA